MKHIKNILDEMNLSEEPLTPKKPHRKKKKTTIAYSLTVEENPMELVPLTEFIVRKATGQNTENVSWYVDDMNLYMELFKYKNLDEACREIYETKIAGTKILVDEEGKKEEAFKWIKGILKSLEK